MPSALAPLALALAQHPGQMAGSVAGGGHRGQDELPGGDLVAVPGRDPAEPHLLGRRHNVSRARRLRQRQAAGDVVVVDVRLQHVRDPGPGGLRGLQHPADVSLRVDDHRCLAVVDQVTAIAQP